MSLIRCKKCGNSISDQAIACPFCGKKPSKGRKVLVILLVILILFSLLLGGLIVYKKLMGESPEQSVEESDDIEGNWIFDQLRIPSGETLNVEQYKEGFRGVPSFICEGENVMFNPNSEELTTMGYNGKWYLNDSYTDAGVVVKNYKLDLEGSEYEWKGKLSISGASSYKLELYPSNVMGSQEVVWVFKK